MGSLNLAGLTVDNAYIGRIKSELENATGQKIPIIEIGKVKRVEGISSVPVRLVFAGGQEAILAVRASADVYKVTLNGKAFACSGDFSDDYKPTFDSAVISVATAIRKGQAKFEQARSKEKVKIPPARDDKGRLVPTSTTARYKQVIADEAELDKGIAEKTAQRDQLQQQIAQIKAQQA